MKTVSHRFCEKDTESERWTWVKTGRERAGERTTDIEGQEREVVPGRWRVEDWLAEWVAGWLVGGTTSACLGETGSKTRNQEFREQKSSTRQNPRHTLPCGNACNMTVWSWEMHLCTQIKLSQSRLPIRNRSSRYAQRLQACVVEIKGNLPPKEI